MGMATRAVQEFTEPGTSLAVQWLGLRASTAGCRGSIPDGGTKTLHAVVWQKKKKRNLLSQK